MGRLAERLALRRHPRFFEARELARQAARALEAEDEQDELNDEVVGYLHELSPAEFDEFIAVAVSAAQLLPDGDEVVDALQDAVAHLSTCIEGDPSDDVPLHCWLFALPLRVPEGTGLQALVLSQERTQQITKLMVNHDLLDIEGEIRLLPRLLSPAQTSSLRPVDLHRLTNALSCEADDAALGWLEEACQREAGPGDRDPPAETAAGSRSHSPMGLLVGVALNDALPFVLAQVIAQETEDLVDNCDGDEQAHVRAQQHIEEDMHDVLDALAAELAPALGVPEVEVLGPAFRWAEVATEFGRLHRAQHATDLVERVAQEHCAGDTTGLTLQASDRRSETYTLVRKRDGVSVGVLPWRELPDEDWRDTLGQLMELLDELGVEPRFDTSDTPPPEGTIH